MKSEKEIRIEYQDLVYGLCGLMDRYYGRSVTKGTGTTIQTLMGDMESIIDGRSQLGERFDVMDREIEDMKACITAKNKALTIARNFMADVGQKEGFFQFDQVESALNLQSEDSK